MLRQKTALLLRLWGRHQPNKCKSLMCTSVPKGTQSKVPQHPVDVDITSQDLPVQTKIDIELVQHLEKLSLVNFANKEGLLRLQAAIDMADQLSLVNTEGVEPLYSVLENGSIRLAEDEVLFENMADDMLGCANKTLEDYFVVPPGNIDYIREEEYYDKLKEKEEKT